MVVLFTAWGYEVTILELASVALALTAIALGIKGTRWTWPLYFMSSLLYGILFLQFDLFASASLQLVFMIAAVWGWFTWGAEGVREPGRLRGVQRLLILGGSVAAWLALAPLLRMIGGAATWGDAFVLVGSLVAQVLMVTEKVEAWPTWIIVDLVGTVLYATQGLYFTALFYAVLVGMAIVGWRSWYARSSATVAEPPVAAGV